MTLLMHHALTHGSPDQIKIIEQVLGNEDVTLKQHQAVKEVVNDIGSLQYTEQKATEFADKARSVVSGQDWPKDITRFLSGLIDYVIERNG